MSIDLPDEGQWTLCEINCRLLHVNEESAAASQGLAYPAIRLRHDISQDQLPLGAPVYAPAGTGEAAEVDEDDIGQNAIERLAVYASTTIQPLHGPFNVLQKWLMGYGLLGEPSIPSSPVPPAWHPHKPTIAVAGLHDLVHVYYLSAAEQRSNGTTQPTFVEQAKVVLAHKLQKQVGSLAWRPNCGSVLAVGCHGGVLLWAVSGSVRVPLSGRGVGGRSGPWTMFLRASNQGARMTSLAWSPDGRLLAAASPEMSGLLVWEAATGIAVPVRSGFTALKMLRWSPCGNYLFAGGAGSRLYMWETAHWNCQSWDAAGSGQLTNAFWTPNGRVLLAAFNATQQLVAMHLVGDPPSLTAQLMPVVLPDITRGSRSMDTPDQQSSQCVRMSNGYSSSSSSSSNSIADLAWDPRGERLVVLLRPPHPAAGMLAVYATTTEPIVHAQLIGYARAPRLDNGDAAARWEDCSLAVHQCFSRGAVFTLRMGQEYLYNLPLYFRQ